MPCKFHSRRRAVPHFSQDTKRLVSFGEYKSLFCIIYFVKAPCKQTQMSQIGPATHKWVHHRKQYTGETSSIMQAGRAASCHD